MADTTGTKQKMTPFPPTFYVANVMEIFERMAWYGFFALSSLYMTSPVSQGGLGFNSIERGILQGIIPFLLYLFPVITGALADRYGYRNTFLVAFGIMTPAYFLLGQFTSFWGFFGAFLLVAIGAATFKPVVVGTVGRLTDDSNRGLGFGIFYTIVNVGGFVGPIFAGALRVLDWSYVFILLAVTIAINFIPTLFFYKEPPIKGGGQVEKKSLAKTIQGAQEVLGNGRFALMVGPILLFLMLSGGGWLGWWYSLVGSVAWIALVRFVPGWPMVVLFLPYTFALIAIERMQLGTVSTGLVQGLAIPGAIWIVLFGFLWMRANRSGDLTWSKEKPQIGNWPFVLYLLILSGFWASFQQIFITMPEYIRDFTDTANLVAAAGVFGDGFVNFIASVNIDQLSEEITRLAAKYQHIGSEADARALFFELVHYKVRVPLEEITATFNSLGSSPDAATVTAIANEWANNYRQVNPEYIVNIDAGSIVIFQILVSWVIQRWKPFPVLVVGVIVAGTGIALGSLAVTGGLAVMAIVVFAFGEMIASPKSQEYVAKIAPGDKTALFMGYYFVSMALGNLFSGILSGWGYEVLAKEQNNPQLMWLIFGGVGFLTAIALLFYNKLVVPKLEAEAEARAAAESA